MPCSEQLLVPFKPGGKFVEVGGGNNPILHPNVDIIAAPTVDIVHDLSSFPWPLEAEAYDGVFSQYAIEHVEWRKTMDFIRELYRILKPDGRAFIITANLLEQCKSVVKEGVNQGTVERVFGSQEFPNYGGVHKTGFSPEYAKELFKKAGFGYVEVLPHPVSETDMIIKAYKIVELFEREYFEDGTTGYHGYRDFCTHYSTARYILNMKPESVLDVGCGRAYTVRILENSGIQAYGIDISKHCWHTRATDSMMIADATVTPWGFKDKEYDLCFSSNLLEHIPEDKVENVIREMIRVSKRGLHAIHFTNPPYQELDKDTDITHVTMKTKEEWIDKFKTISPDYPIQIEYPRTIEYERPFEQPPISIAPGTWRTADGRIGHVDDLHKLNIGSYKNMFYFGWINLDILEMTDFAKGQSYLFQQMDVLKGLPFNDNDVDIIFHSHLLEHFSRAEGTKFLKECYRIMKPGGLIRISVPDARLLIGNYLSNTIKGYRYINIGVENAKDDAEALHELLMSNHKTLYDEAALTKLLSDVGFKEIRRETPFTSRSDTIRKQTINTFPSLSCIIEATPDK